MHCKLGEQQFISYACFNWPGLKHLNHTLKSTPIYTNILEYRYETFDFINKLILIYNIYWPVSCSRHTDDLGWLLTLRNRVQVHSQITPILNKPKQLKTTAHSLSLHPMVITVLDAFLKLTQSMTIPYLIQVNE